MSKQIVVPKVEEVQSVMQLGLGTMGYGWAVNFLMGGLDVYVHEPHQPTVEKNLVGMQKLFGGVIKKGLWNGDPEKAMTRLHLVDSPEALMECGAPVLLEVVTEDLDLKCQLFAKLSEKIPAGTILWSNTSCLDVLRMGEASGHPKLFVGTHGMNPVPFMKAVEVVRTDKVNSDVLAFTMAILERLGKMPLGAKNIPGFVVNHILIPAALASIGILVREENDVLTVDKLVKYSLGWPQGIFQLMDRVGLDVMVFVAMEMYRRNQQPGCVTPKLLHDMVDADFLGAKSGRGFYDWSNPKDPQPIAVADLTKPAETADAE